MYGTLVNEQQQESDQVQLHKKQLEYEKYLSANIFYQGKVSSVAEYKLLSIHYQGRRSV